jgi:hypothetical protein
MYIMCGTAKRLQFVQGGIYDRQSCHLLLIENKNNNNNNKLSGAHARVVSKRHAHIPLREMEEVIRMV